MAFSGDLDLFGNKTHQKDSSKQFELAQHLWVSLVPQAVYQSFHLGLCQFKPSRFFNFEPEVAAKGKARSAQVVTKSSFHSDSSPDDPSDLTSAVLTSCSEAVSILTMSDPALGLSVLGEGGRRVVSVAKCMYT